MKKGATPTQEIGLNFRIGLAIKEKRRRLGLSQSALAADAKISRPMITAIELGSRNTRLNCELLERIAKALEFGRLSDLIRFAEDVPDLETSVKDAHTFIEPYVR